MQASLPGNVSSLLHARLMSDRSVVLNKELDPLIA